MSEKEKMLSGQVYSATDPELLNELNEVKGVIHRYNSLSPSDTDARFMILKSLLGYTADDEFIINQPFYCDYGKQIRIGRRFFANFNLTILDEALVTIGDDCFIGPNVSIRFDLFIITSISIQSSVQIYSNSLLSLDVN